MQAELYQILDTTLVFLKRDLKVRYASSILGPLWIVLYPLLLVGVVAFIFSYVFSYQMGEVPYSLFALSGLIHWIYFSQSLSHLTRSFFNQGNLIANASFPIISVPLSIVLSRLIDYFVGLSLLIILLNHFGYINLFTFVLIIPLICLQTILQFGLGLMFASLNIFWRDTQYLVDIGLQILFYATPIIYSLEIIPNNLRKFLFINPLVIFFDNYHSLFFTGKINSWYLFFSMLISVIFLLIGLVIYKKYRYQIPEAF